MFGKFEHTIGSSPAVAAGDHKFYEKVFELILRLKGNYLWPAMWGNAFYDDDPKNRETADKYGIVIGTSHHEPLMRAHDEWRRYGKGKWNYDANPKELQRFWREGMQRASNEKIVSIGMRGDGDEPMTEGTAIALLEKIVTDQRKIISEVTRKPVSETPQLWALYKEVQDYYDKGMRVPDDVTLLLCDDNWGNIRRLPKLNEPARKGGYGIYYHFDYVGGPRNYKWLNTNNLARVWEQMHLAWEYRARQIWIVNVGDIKPMELPISFFLDYAWDPNKWNETNIRDYYVGWSEQQFGKRSAPEIGRLLREYAQLAARRKPELLDASTYALQEWTEVITEWNALRQSATSVNQSLEPEQRDAFFQFVLHPVTAMTNLHHMYYNVALNKFHYSKKHESANQYAEYAKQHYLNDSLITLQYHHLNEGKWNYMMSQTHIGYTYWQQPEVNKMPPVYYVHPDSTEQELPANEQLLRRFTGFVPKGAFYQNDGYVSIEAEHWTRSVGNKIMRWVSIPDIGRTGAGITTFPVLKSVSANKPGPRVEYDIYTYDTGTLKLNLYFSPTLNFHNNGGLKFAVSIDDEKPQVITLNKEDHIVHVWEKWVANNIIIKTSQHNIHRKGRHTVKYWAISPGVILQKVVVDFGNVPQTYLGPPETRM